MSTSGSPLAELAEVIAVIEQLLERVPAERFASPFAIAALVPELLGLEEPLEGSGASPYSLASVALELRGGGAELARLAELPLRARRQLADELQAMIVPTLLGEQERYVELLASARFRAVLAEHGGEAELRATTREKLALTSRLIARARPTRRMCAHIAHVAFEEDLLREDPVLRTLAPEDLERWYELSFPVVVETTFRGFARTDGADTDAQGWMIMIPNSAEQLLTSRELRTRKLNDAAALAARLGARTVGMAGLVASFAQGGHGLAKAFPTMGFTTGHAFTIANVVDIATAAIERVGLDPRKATIAIVGAAGSIGSGCARLVARQLRPRRMILTDTSPFVAEPLARLCEAAKAVHPDVELSVFANNDLVVEADVVIVATNAAEAVLSASHLKPGAIVVDDSFPKCVARSVLDERDDVVLLEGGLVQLPYGVDVTSSQRFQDTLDAPLTRVLSCKQIYGCLAETIVLTLRGHEGSYGLGLSDDALAAEVFGWARRSGFARAPLQSFDLAISEARFEAARAAVRARGLAHSDR